jgi:hypothetical protein
MWVFLLVDRAKDHGKIGQMDLARLGSRYRASF